jgi:hypothetical protein
MTRLELETSLEATYLNRMVSIRTSIGRVETIAVEDRVHRNDLEPELQRQITFMLTQTGELRAYRLSEQELLTEINILNGDTTGGNGRDVAIFL